MLKMIQNSTSTSSAPKRLILGTLLALLAATGIQAPARAITVPTFGAFPAINATWGVGAVAVTPPTSNSGGSWSLTSSNPSVASVVAGTTTLAILNIGTSTITASQASFADFGPKNITTVLTVGAATPVTGSFPAINTALDQKTVSLTEPTSQSSGAWTYISSNPSVASVLGSTLTLNSMGTVTVTATQAANYNWAAVIKTALVTITGGAPVVSPFPDMQVVLGSVLSMALNPPTSTSSGAWTFTSSNPAVATVVGNVLTPLSVGTSTISAIQAASANYASVTKTMTVTVVGGPPTVGAFPDVTVALKPLATNSFTLPPPTSNSSGTWTYISANLQVATIAGNVVTVVGAGTSVISATQAASGKYGASSPVSMNLTVTGAAPTVGKWPDIARNLSDGKFTLTPPTSTSAGAWSYKSENPNIATVSGNEVTPVGVGKAIITATQASDIFWASATAQLSLSLNGIVPVVGSFAPISIGLGDAPFNISFPTSTSSGEWVLTSSNPAIASVTGTHVAAVGLGVTTISAIQSAQGNYSASAPVTFTVTVLPVPEVSALQDKNVSLSEKTVLLTDPTSTSSGTWSYTSSDSGLATVDGKTVHLLSVGTVTIKAIQAGTKDFAPVTKTFTIKIGSKSPVVGSLPSISLVVGEAPRKIATPTSDSSGEWVFTSANPSIVSIANGSLISSASGTAIITGIQSAQGEFSVSAPITFTVTVLGKPTIGSITNRTSNLSEKSITLSNPASNSPGLWSFTSSNPKIVAVSGNVLTPKAVGVVTITAIQSATATFSSATTTFTVTVSPGTANIVWNPIIVKMTGAGSVIVPPLSPSKGVWGYTISDLSVAVIAGGKIQGLKAGKTTITATQVASGTYGALRVTTTLTVVPSVSITASGRTITVSVSGGIGKVLINDKPAVVGKNVVTAGAKIVRVFVNGLPVLTRSLNIK
jgi:hypothetical protein